ncbi:CD1375 family protein [Treponema sp.]
MAKIYADLIRKGKKTIEDVPEAIREEVQRILDEDN